MEQYIISKLALAKAQLEVDLLGLQWKLEQADKRIKQLEEELKEKEGTK